MRSLRTTLVVLGLAFWAGAAPAQEEAAEAKQTLAIEAITLEPAAPAVDTLCRLRVKVRNTGGETVSALFFRVAINGQDLEVYKNQIFMDRLDAETQTEVALYNFWTTETRRPPPADGKLKVTVELREAQLLEVTTEDDGTEVWTLGDAVGGLPASKELVVTLKKDKGQ